MPYRTFKSQQEVEAVDIATMADMTEDDYREYLEDGLLLVDHHDILRSQPAGYPLAVTKAQFKALLRYLQELEPRIGGR
jgi:hypothetical protein